MGASIPRVNFIGRPLIVALAPPLLLAATLLLGSADGAGIPAGTGSGRGWKLISQREFAQAGWVASYPSATGATVGTDGDGPVKVTPVRAEVGAQSFLAANLAGSPGQKSSKQLPAPGSEGEPVAPAPRRGDAWL
ncbi:MAG: hypothetical protein ACYDC5_02040 [Candidatus Dormibacteria bacterium]